MRLALGWMAVGVALTLIWVMSSRNGDRNSDGTRRFVQIVGESDASGLGASGYAIDGAGRLWFLGDDKAFPVVEITDPQEVHKYNMGRSR